MDILKRTFNAQVLFKRSIVTCRLPETNYVFDEEPFWSLLPSNQAVAIKLPKRLLFVLWLVIVYGLVFHGSDRTPILKDRKAVNVMQSIHFHQPFTTLSLKQDL